MRTTTISVPPIVGMFDDIGRAERAVRDLHAAHFGREAVGLAAQTVTVTPEEPPAPPALAVPYAVGASLLGGALLGLLAAHFAPPTVTIAGFDWRVSSVLILALVGGAGGWMLGGILGFGFTGRDTLQPAPTALPAPAIAVTVQAPGRPEEARTILRAAGAREISGGERVYPDAGTSDEPEVRGTAPRGTPPDAAPRRFGPTASEFPHERATVTHGARQDGVALRWAGLALVLAIVAGAAVVFFRRR